MVIGDCLALRWGVVGGGVGGWGDGFDLASVDEGLEVGGGHEAGVSVAFGGPGAQVGFGFLNDLEHGEAFGGGGADCVEDGFFGVVDVVAGFVEPGVDGFGGGAVGPVAGVEALQVHGLELADGAEAFVDVHVGGGDGLAAVEEVVSGALDGVADDGGFFVGEVDAEVAVGVSGEVEDVEDAVGSEAEFACAVVGEIHGDVSAAAWAEACFGGVVGSEAVGGVVGAVALFDEGIGGFDLGAVGCAADAAGLRCGLFHAEEAAGVVDIGVGGEDVGELGGVEVDGLEVGEDVFFWRGGVAGVHEEGGFGSDEEVEFEGSIVVVDGDLVDVGEDFGHEGAPCCWGEYCTRGSSKFEVRRRGCFSARSAAGRIWRMMNAVIGRMLDANANRAREALRVLEDYARFGLDDQGLSAALKEVRHGLAGALARLGGGDAILCRDTAGDVGTGNKTEREFVREGLGDVVIAAGKRLSEALRVIEEAGKTVDPAAAAEVERLRYKGYELEQMLARAVGQAGRFAGVRLYVLVTERLCRRGWEETLEAILGAGEPGEIAVQLREKEMEGGELLRRARVLVEKCRAAGAVSVVNDRVDVALLAGADGVHVGQGDLPCAEIRRMAGRELIVGVSTGRLEEARQAVRDGATYVGVGPMFPTTTKEKPHLAGPAYAAEAVGALPVPCVAIGGIMAGNVGELTAVGVRCVAVCAGVIACEDVGGACRELLGRLRTP